MTTRRRHLANRAAKLREMGKPIFVYPEEFERAKARLLRAREQLNMSDRQVAAVVGGLDCTLVGKIRNGRTKTMRRETYEAVMRARFQRPATHRAGAHVDSVPTTRRLRALQADGFTCDYLAGLLGVSRKNMSNLTRRNTAVLASTRDEIAALYDKLDGMNPAGLFPPEILLRVRTLSRQKGWAPRGCWDPDTIDDPQAIPEWTGACGTYIGRQIHQRDDIPMCEPCRTADGGPPGAFSPRKFRQARQATGMSMADLEQACGFAYGAIYWWESGRSTPRKKNLAKALEVLNITLGDVLEDEETDAGQALQGLPGRVEPAG